MSCPWSSGAFLRCRASHSRLATPCSPPFPHTTSTHDMAWEVVRSCHGLDNTGRECEVIQDFPGNPDVWLSFLVFIFSPEAVGLVSAKGALYRRFPVDGEGWLQTQGKSLPIRCL